MIRIAICDDEKNIRTYLSSLVRKQNIECEITEYASTDEYLSDQKEHDLLFLDIEMKSVASGMDGMSMAKQIRATELTKQPIIIFVTGYEKYVYDAFDVGAFQYLLKPIDEQRFAQVFRRAAEQIISEAEQRMSETEFVLFQNIIGGIETFLYAVCLTAFFYPFMTEKKERQGSKLKKILIVFGSYIAISLIGNFVPAYGWLGLMIVIILLTASSGYLGMNRNFTFFMGIIFFCIRNLSMLIVESIDFFTSRYWVQEKTLVEDIFRNASLNYIFIAAFRIFLFLIMLFVVGHRLGKQKIELQIRELCYLILTPIVAILFGNIIVRLWIVVKDDLIFQLYEQYPIFLGIVPVIAILFYAGILITIVSYQEMEKLQEEKKKHFIEEQQVHSIQERMEEVEQFYNGIRQMKHEMRNHLTNIKGLMESGNYEDMQQYLSKMDESMNVFEITIQTGNAVTDVIVNDKQKAASKQGVQFQSEFSYPVSDRYDAYDIGIIVNNLLQNALEACEKMNTGERYITLSGKQKRKFFLIEVRNSFDGEIKFDSNTNLPVSDKEKDISLHGIGLSNVKREVEKYMGDLDIKVKKNEFSVTILLQERRTENEY